MLVKFEVLAPSTAAAEEILDKVKVKTAGSVSEEAAQFKVNLAHEMKTELSISLRESSILGVACLFGVFTKADEACKQACGS